MKKTISVLLSGIICASSMTIFPMENPSAEELTIQAEDCILNGCSVGNYGEGYDGSRYVELIDEVNDGMTAKFNVSAGMHTFKIRYSQGEYDSNTLSLYVNSEFVKQLEFKHTGGWNVSWADAYVQLSELPEGDLDFELRYDEGDGNVDIDYIKCTDNGIIAEDPGLFDEFDNNKTVFTTTDGKFDFVVGRDPHLCATITDYNESSADIAINNMVEDIRVTRTAIDLSGRNDINSVTYTGLTMPELGISGSFAGCANMKRFTVLPELCSDDENNPENCRIAVSASFENCTSLTSVSFPACFPLYYTSLCSSIGANTFRNCTSLPEISLDGYWEIGEAAFAGCTSLNKVVLTKETNSIGDYAFGYIQNEDGSYSRYEGLTIYGVPGTVSERYANDNDIPFVSIDVSGDINCDGKFEVSDFVCMSKYVNCSDECDIISQGVINGDLTEDGNVNVFDLIAARRKLLNNTH